MTQPTVAGHTAQFVIAMEELAAAEQAFQSGQVASVPHANARERLLIDGIVALAGMHGFTIERPTSIDARGEVAIFGARINQTERHGYGPAFAELLSTIPRRTGTQPTMAPVLAESNWCWVNHFDLAALLVAQHREHVETGNQQVLARRSRPTN
ncbi:Uncharacterised protein [Achromobacter sp. 2789STDY5608633]|jgi:hypothetical protein|uniref:hypothetical protein n=1 Tax=Achromobacter sp. 2789STDY5608633 TaxID=1806501 RepID=UPI0006C1378F|nr:hypothetical protein [Achromobacter sp. 2789STDY5608633]CUJ49113.1 Uncharacterised protein [Achromobacter sp. 2789STDY5608633]